MSGISKRSCAFFGFKRPRVLRTYAFVRHSFCTLFAAFLLLSNFLRCAAIGKTQDGSEKNAVVFQKYVASDCPAASSRSQAFALPFLLNTSAGQIKDGSDRHTYSRSCKKFKAAKRKKRRTYHIKRKTIRRFKSLSRPRSRSRSLPRDKAEQLAKLKMAAHLLCPIRRSDFWLSSPFGYRRMSNGACGFHAGIDMAAVRGVPVRAAASGRVIKTSSSTIGYGNMILISHAYQLTTRYAHLCRIRVKEGQYVNRGDIIGTVGNTGNVRHKKGRDGSHLHFEVYVGKKRINPLFFLNERV